MGPKINSAVLASGLPVRATYALLAICPAIYGACVLTIGLIERRGRIVQAQAPSRATAAEA